jgi:DNA-binding beta-propeller fold protein YncE
MATGAITSLVNANSNQIGAVSTEIYLRASQVASVSSVMLVVLPSLSTAVSAISSALSTEISATSVNISSAVSTVIGGAPANFDTLYEIASELQTNSSLSLVASVLNQATTISTALSTATSTRIGAVSSVSSALSGAVSSLTVANSNASTVLLTEVNGRGASILSVSTAINNANVALTAVDGTLSTTLYSENSTRALSVASVATGVNNVSAALVAVAAGLNSTLSTEVVNRTVSVASLSTSLTNANSTLVSVDSTISTTLSSENVARISAIGSVSGVLSTSAIALQSAMSATSTSILTVSAQAALKATTSYLNAQVSTVLGGAPSSLDTISELAAALNNAYNFAGSITGVLGTKAAAADVDSISSTLALKANQVDYTSLSSVVVNKANTVSADTVGAAVVALNNTATTLVADVATLKAGGGNIDSNAVSVGGVTLGDLVNWTKEIYVKIGSTNADGTINEKLNRLANPTNVSNVLSFEYDANGAVSKVSQLVTLKFDKSQTRVSVTGGVGNPTVSMSNLVLDSNNNYLFTFPYVGNAEYYTTNKTAVVITALESQYMLAPAVPTVSLSALDVSSSNYKNATPIITTPHAATTWDDGAEIITQPVTIQTESGSVLKFDTGTYTGVTIEVGSGATLVSNKTFSTTGASSTYLVKYAPSIVNNVGAISVSVMGSSSKLPSDTSTIANVFNDYAQYATPTLVSGSKIVSRSVNTYTLTASFDSVSMYGLYNASNQNVTNEVGHPNAFVLRKSTADWRPLMRQQNPYRSEIGAFSSNYDDPQQTYQLWSPDSQFNTSYSGNEIAKKFAYYASYWLTRLKIPTDQYLSVPVYTGRNYSILFWGSTIYYNASDVFAGYLTFGMEGSTLVCRLSGYNSGTKYTFTVQSDAVATATAENNADAGTLRISNGLPNLMVVRTADTWKDKVPLITASLANAQSWGGVNGGYDIQFYDVTYSSSNQVAVQFAYFAQYWLNRLNVPVGKAMSVPVIAAQGAVGIFSFWKITSSTYGGNLSTFSSNNYEFQVQADAIAAGIAAQVKYVASVTYLAASLGQSVLKVRVPTAGALRASNYLTINGEGLAAHAAPMLSGSVAYSGSAGAYTATSTHTFNANVSAIKVMKSDGTTIIASQAVSSGTATIVISYTTADISGSKSFHVVALGNDFGTDSLASVSQMLVDPPPVLTIPPPAIQRAGTVSSGSSTLTTFGSQGSADGQFGYPRGIATDAAGNIYVVDQNNHRIQSFTSDGVFRSSFGSYGTTGNGTLNYPRGIATDASGKILVVDQYNHRIQSFTSAGIYVSSFGSEGLGNGQFKFPRAIAIDATGNIYVADTSNHRIQVFTSAGTYVSQFGTNGTGNGQFNAPEGVAIDATGNIYVVDQNNHRIQSFTSDGVFRSSFGSYGTGNGKFNNPQGVAIDATGNICVADTSNHRIQLFNSAGMYVSQFGSLGSATGQFNNPVEIAINASGKILAVDQDNHRVQIVGGV